MFTDIVGSTEMTARLGDRLSTELVRAHNSIVRRCLNQLVGREVKHTGRALDEHGLLELVGQEHHRADLLVADVVLLGQLLEHLVDR